MRDTLVVSGRLFGGAGHPGVISGSAANRLSGLLPHGGRWSGLGTWMVPTGVVGRAEVPPAACSRAWV